MLASERHNLILSRLRAASAVTVTELTALLQVSVETLRRDLLHLERLGHLQRVYGGAILPGEMKAYPDLSRRMEDNRKAKEQLSRTAAALVRDDDVLYIDSGSTAASFALVLKEQFSRLTVITHSMDVFEVLRNCAGFRLFLCGGMYLPEENAFHGQLALDTMQRLHADKTFLFPSAISLHNGVCDFSHDLLPIQQQMIAGCNRLYVLADSSKFEKNALLKICDTTAHCTFVTDSGLAPGIRHLYAEHNLTVLTGQEEE